MRRHVLILMLFALVAAGALQATPAAGIPPCSTTAGYTVQTTADEQDGPPTGGAGPDGKLSLREAIASASHDAATSTITVPAGTFRLTMGDLAPGPADCDLTVAGAGARSTTLDAGGNSRIMEIASGTQKFTISGVTLTGGSAAGGSGGAIDAHSDLSLDKVTVTRSSAQDDGGGVAASGPLTISASTVSANRASPSSNPATPSVAQGLGGGIYSAGAVKVTDSTISGNHALPGSGGDGQGGGVWTGSSLDIQSSTLADNSAGGGGGNVYATGGTSENSLFVNGAPNNCSVPLGSNDSGDKSLTSDTTCFSAGSQQSKGTPLGPLANNGGPTDTRTLLTGNAALDGGDSIACDGSDLSSITIDQRGVSRPQGAGCDVGAYELVRTASLSIRMTAAPNPVVVGHKVTYTITVRSFGPLFDATQPTVVDHRPAGTSFVSATPSQGTCAGTATVTCALGTVANGSSATVRVVLKATRTGALSNTATESSPRPDFSAGDDQATAKVTVIPKCSLKPGSSNVTVSRLSVAAKSKKAKRGILRLTATCDGDAPLQLAGTLRVTAKRKKGKPKPKTTSISLPTVDASAKAHVPRKLTVRLPEKALKALENGAKESARFTLKAYGTTVATAKIGRLRAVRKR